MGYALSQLEGRMKERDPLALGRRDKKVRSSRLGDQGDPLGSQIALGAASPTSIQPACTHGWGMAEAAGCKGRHPRTHSPRACSVRSWELPAESPGQPPRSPLGP